MPTRCGHPIKSDADAIEKIQKRATKLVITFKKLSCIDRLVHLGFPTLKYTDDYEVTITKHKYDYKVAPELIYNINKVTTANDFRLSKNRSHYDLRKYFRSLIELLIFATSCLYQFMSTESMPCNFATSYVGLCDD